MKRKLIFLDIDGTLTAPGSNVPPASAVEAVRKELDAEGIPYSDEVDLGIMIETPAAAVISDRLAKEVDFFSCGTNDLTQYTLACDRQNNDLGRFFNAHHPAVLRLIKLVAENAQKTASGAASAANWARIWN